MRSKVVSEHDPKRCLSCANFCSAIGLSLLVGLGISTNAWSGTKEPRAEPLSPDAMHTFFRVDINELYPFSRVFTTQQQRFEIDLARRARAKDGVQTTLPSADGTPSEASSEPEIPEQLRFSGMVLRADGKHMVWIDGRSELSKVPPEGKVEVKRLKNGRLEVPIEVQSKLTLMKPGQVWLVEEGKVEEGYLVPKAPDKTLDQQIEEAEDQLSEAQKVTDETEHEAQ